MGLNMDSYIFEEIETKIKKPANNHEPFEDVKEATQNTGGKMKKSLFINESLEYDTYTAVRDFFELLTGQGIIYGEKINREKKNYPNDIADSLIHLIKDGSVPNVEDALLYCMNKTGISFNMENDKKRMAWNNLLQILRDYNGGYNIISNGCEKYSFIAENKTSKITKTGKNLLFFNADLNFDYYKNKKNGFYDHISLIEGDTPIRRYTRGVGEERSIRYEVLNGMGRILTTPDKITYKAMDVQDSYVFHHDFSHGWLEVPAQEIKAIGVEKRITLYSYLNKDMVYLEKNIDARTFLDMRILLPNPISLQNNFMDGRCFVRNFPHYKPENVIVEKEKTARKTSRSKDIEWER
jgi:hypothetical protein